MNSEQRDELKRDLVAIMVGIDRTDHPLFLARANAAIDRIARALEAAPKVGEGFVVVPREPEHEVICKLAADWGYTLEEAASTYEDVVEAAAAPTPSTDQQEVKS